MSKITKVDTTKINLNYNKNKQGNKNQSNNNDNNIIKKINTYITTSIESYAIESLNKYYKLSEGIYDINNSNGEFGGDQEVFVKYFELYIKDEKVREIINKYYPNEELTKEDLHLLFSRMSAYGCTYISACNSIYNNALKTMSYKEFQDKFGFPPYYITTTADGETFKKYNYAYMFMDFYLYYQKKFNNFKSVKEIYGNEKELLLHANEKLPEDEYEITGAEGAVQQLSQAVSDYLEKKDIKISIPTSELGYLKEYGFLDDNTNITNNNINAYKKALKDGKEIAVLCGGFDIYNVTKDSKDNIKATDQIKYEKVGSHVMSVVGVDEEKRKLIVSTWGECAAIDVNDVYGFWIYDFDKHIII